ncbi:MAG: M24 family metallopeptidase [Geminicoccaceae bacterium]|nr:MAG: M24 family metallopeptidase [Geminicoccaceae bacterium]
MARLRVRSKRWLSTLRGRCRRPRSCVRAIRSNHAASETRSPSVPDDATLPFTTAEYADRLNRTRAAMEAAGIEALLVTDPSNMAWLTGYDGWSFYVHQGVVVTPAEPPFWWGRRMDLAGARRTTYLAEPQLLGYPDDYVQARDRHPVEHLADWLRGRGWGAKRLGLELDNYYFSAAAYLNLVAELPDARMVDATGLVNRQRTVKSAQELVYMRRAARIVEAMHDVIRERVAPGVRKSDLVADIYHQAISGADGHGGDYPAIVPMLPTGKDAAAPHLTWDDTPLAAGAGTFFEIAGCHRRYHVPLCRTVHLGPPPRAMRDAEAALLEGLEAGIEAARAGNRAADVANALGDVLARAGLGRAARAGYPVGLSYPPDWGERTISLRPSDDSVLEPGMTFHFMPGLWMDDWGIEITETILIEEHGPASCLAQVPRPIVVKP